MVGGPRCCRLPRATRRHRLAQERHPAPSGRSTQPTAVVATSGCRCGSDLGGPGCGVAFGLWGARFRRPCRRRPCAPRSRLPGSTQRKRCARARQRVSHAVSCAQGRPSEVAWCRVGGRLRAQTHGCSASVLLWRNNTAGARGCVSDACAHHERVAGGDQFNRAVLGAVSNRPRARPRRCDGR